VKILIDMNLSPGWARVLNENNLQLKSLQLTDKRQGTTSVVPPD
jgi:predicted nuclease of predicted toxin-antitoxin system